MGVDREVLKAAASFVRENLKVTAPHIFYDAGTVVGIYYIKWNGLNPDGLNQCGVDVNDIQRELEMLFRSGELSVDQSWMDPRAIDAQKERIREWESKNLLKDHRSE